MHTRPRELATRHGIQKLRASSRWLGARIALFASLALTSTLIAGCTEQVLTGSGAPVPVIQTVLVGDADSVGLWAELSTPADSAVSDSPRPLPPGEVALNLSESGGSAVPLAPSLVAGLYTASLVIRPAIEYSLAGTVRGAAVFARVRVPAPLSLALPAEDTIRLDRSACSGTRCLLAVEWGAPGAAVLEVVQRDGVAGTLGTVAATLLRESAGSAQLLARQGEGQLVFIAHDTAAANFLFATPSVGNIAGVAGFLGAQTVLKRVLIWE